MSKLKELVQQSGMTQTEIAISANIDPATLSQYINNPEKIGTARINTLIKLCNVLNCSPVEIVGGVFWAKEELETMKVIEQYTANELQGMFTSGEKHYLVDVLNDSIYSHKITPKEYLKVQIIDSVTYDNLDSKWEVAVKDFIKKIDSLTSHQCYIIIKTISNTKGQKIDIDNLF